MTYYIPSLAPMDQAEYQAKCLQQLQVSVAALGGDAQSPVLVDTAELIIRSMTGPWRSFHTPGHIFDVGHGGGPVEVIAALFHDLVYVQVDQGIHVNLSRHISPCVREVGQTLVIEPVPGVVDPLFEMLLTLFGFQVGHKLSPFAGQNEFLSALAAVRILQPLLPVAALTQIAACIEATVPFRGPSAQGQDCSEQLQARLLVVNERMQLGFDAASIGQTVEMCVRLANRDIDNFASEDPAEFLNNTWNLIPETNHDLLNANTYTVQGYRVSLQKMEGFLGFLQPGVVFRRFGAEPSEAEHQRRLSLTQRNLEVARLYLRIKLLSVGLLEALSMRMGHDVALASMMGDRPVVGENQIQLEQFLPTVAVRTAPVTDIERAVTALLEQGRTADSMYDTRHSPVGGYLVRHLGFQECLRLLDAARAFFADSAQAQGLLAAFPPEVLAGIVNGIARVMQSRIDELTRH